MKYVFLSLSILFLLNSCQPAEKRVITGEAQGTYYRVVYYHQQELVTQEELDELLKAFDKSASNYAPESVISKINRNESMEVDETFTEIFELAGQVSEETDGMFDITVRPLVELYGFGKTDEVTITDARRDSVMHFVGYQKVRIEKGKVQKDDPRIQLDFNAIAQGYSVDYLLDYLVKKGFKVVMVDIGGEVRSYGMKPDGKSWRVGIEVPAENADYGQEISAIVELKSKALATSGNYRKFVEKDGVKYVHTLNPKDGSTVQSKLLSASILASTAGEADAYATACMVMGLEASIRFVEEKQGLEAFFIYFDENGAYKHYVTEGMKKVLAE